MPRYQEDNELHRDFQGTTNKTFDPIADNFGLDALKSILRAMWRNIYKTIHDKLAKGNASELVEPLNWFFFREGAQADYDCLGTVVLQRNHAP